MSDTTPIPPASERERFEADARPYGFDLTRDENTTGEPWCDYKDHDTGHRWGGWLAALEPHKLPVGAALSHPSTPKGWQCPKCGIERHGPLIACMQDGCPPPEQGGKG